MSGFAFRVSSRGDGSQLLLLRDGRHGQGESRRSADSFPFEAEAEGRELSASCEASVASAFGAAAEQLGPAWTFWHLGLCRGLGRSWVRL